MNKIRNKSFRIALTAAVFFAFLLGMTGIVAAQSNDVGAGISDYGTVPLDNEVHSIVVDNDWADKPSGDWVLDGQYKIGDNAFPTICAAADNYSPGDNIYVYPGSYDEGPTGSNHGAIFDNGGFTLISENGPGVTSVNSDDLFPGGSLFKIKSYYGRFDDGSVTINGFKFTGRREYDTAIAISDGQSGYATKTDLVIKNSHFDNLAIGINAWGFGAYSDDRNNRVENIEIINNKFTHLGESGTQHGGAVLLETLADQNITGGDFAATVKNNTFENIAAAGPDNPGAGVVLQWKVYTGDNTELTDSAANAEVTKNEFENVTTDVAVGGTVDNTKINYNNFLDSKNYGVNENNISNSPVDATNNWWGASSGPNGVGPGEGDVVSENVDYSPWLIEPYPTDSTVAFEENSFAGIGDSDSVDASEKSDTIVTFSDVDEGVSGSVDVGILESNPVDPTPTITVKFVGVGTSIPNDNIHEVKIEIQYTDSEISELGLDESSLTIHRWNAESEEWEALNTEVDTAAYTATATVEHLTIFSLNGSYSIGGGPSDTNLVDVWLPYIGIAVLITALVVIAVFSGKEWFSKLRK